MTFQNLLFSKRYQPVDTWNLFVVLSKKYRTMSLLFSRLRHTKGYFLRAYVHLFLWHALQLKRVDEYQYLRWLWSRLPYKSCIAYTTFKYPTFLYVKTYQISLYQILTFFVAAESSSPLFSHKKSAGHIFEFYICEGIANIEHYNFRMNRTQNQLPQNGPSEKLKVAEWYYRWLILYRRAKNLPLSYIWLAGPLALFR